MVLRTTFAILFAAQIANAQVILTEVMFDADTLENYNEFIEIYNMNSFPVDLNGWLVGDSVEQDPLVEVGDGSILQSEQYGIILDAGYFENSDSYDNLIPPEALVLTIDDASFGSFGLSNSVEETILLINASGDTVQTYKYTLDNDPGYSDEKILPSAENGNDNWANSTVLRGTPGSKNSVSPKDIDLWLKSFQLTGQTFVAGTPIPFTIVALNAGSQTIQGVEIATFLDFNQNIIAETDEIIETVQSSETLNSGDSLVHSGQFSGLTAGNISLGVQVSVSGDEDELNNTLTQTVFISDPENQALIINEILFEPDVEQEEWVEVYNPGFLPINLKEVLFADSRDTVRISAEDFILYPGEYAVIAGDSAAQFQYSLSYNQLLIIGSFPTLNNTNDNLILLNIYYYIYDRVNYTSDWYARETDGGTSLEKINPNFNGQISNHWAASVDPSGSTPGRLNSIYVEVLPTEASLDVSPNPFSPDADGFEDFTVIQYKFPVETATIRARLFDTRGRIIRTLADSMPVANEGRLIWDGKDNDGRIARIGPYICLIEAYNAAKNMSEQLKTTIILVKQ